MAQNGLIPRIRDRAMTWPGPLRLTWARLKKNFQEIWVFRVTPVERLP